MNAQLLPPPVDSGLRRLLFEDFELRLDSGELFQGGAPVKLQPQPARVLEVLASRSGEVVSREEIRQLVWGDAFVDLDASLNFCVKEIRRALGDSATSPRFVETVPRRGYRFLMPVRTAEDSRERPLPARPALPARQWWSRLGAASTAVGLLILLTFLLGSSVHPVPTPEARPEKGGEDYLLGIHSLEHQEYEKAESSFEDVILLDPDFAPAYAKLALARLKRMEKPPDPEVTETAARRALELDPSLAEAHAALGQILFLRHLDWEGAGRELQKAVALGPRSADAHLFYSQYLEALGRHAEAMDAVKRARELDPASMLAGANYAWYFYLDGQYEEAVHQARKILKLYPTGAEMTSQAAKESVLICQDTILLSAWRLGDQETALAAAKEGLEVLRLPQQAAQLRDLKEFFRGREQRIHKTMQVTPVDPYYLARTALDLGERHRALDLLSRCAPKGGLAFPFAAVEPAFDELHGDPRWSKILDDCLKLPADAPARDR